MTPRISIITPSFNQGQFIERTIQSVHSQEGVPLEHLIIDGGSQDQTVSILQKYVPQFSYWVSEKDQGHADAINKGIIRSTAPVVGWLNSDDIYFPGALRKVIDYFDTHPDTDVVYGDAQHIDADDQFIENYPTEDWNWDRLIETCFISQPAAFVRRRVFEKFGMMDVKLRVSQDYEFWIRLGKNGVKFDHLHELLAATRLHKDAFTMAAAEKCHRATLGFMVRHIGHAPDRWIFNYAHAVADAKGFRREDRVKFAGALFVYSLAASVRWNKLPSRNLLQTSAGWVYNNAREVLRKRWRG